MKMKKSTDLLQGSGELDWITANGQHIPVGEKESKEEAVKKFVESHENKPNNTQKEQDEQIDEREQNSKNLQKLDKNKPPPDEEAEALKKVEEEKKKELAEKKQKRQQQLSKDIDKILKITNAKELGKGYAQMTDNTPQVLQNIGLPDKPMYMRTDHVYKVIQDNGVLKGTNDNYHGLGKELFMQIPDLLEKPELVFKAPIKTKRNKESVVAVVNAVDKTGKRIIVAIELNSEIAGIGITANRITSAYGKNGFEKYIQKNATKETILYKK